MLVQAPLDSTNRILEVRTYLRMLISLLGPPIAPGGGPLAVRIQALSREGPALKGLFFIHLYGAYEFTVTRMVEETLQVLNAQNLTVVDCKPALLGLILDPQCHALKDAGRDKVWMKRTEMFNLVNSNLPVNIPISVFPTSGRNLSCSELDSIWAVFGLAGSPLPHPRITTRIQEVISKRNEIAHGENTPAQIGRRYSLNDLTLILNDMDLLCTHLIQSFSSYLTRSEFLA